MEKKFYEMPELEVINLQLEGALLSDSDEPTVIPGEGDAEESGLGD